MFFFLLLFFVVVFFFFEDGLLGAGSDTSSCYVKKFFLSEKKIPDFIQECHAQKEQDKNG